MTADRLFALMGKTITMGPQITCIEVHFCQISVKIVSFPIFRFFTVFLIFSDNEIVFIGYLCLDIFLSHFLEFYMVFKKLDQKG